MCGIYISLHCDRTSSCSYPKPVTCVVNHQPLWEYTGCQIQFCCQKAAAPITTEYNHCIRNHCIRIRRSATWNWRLTDCMKGTSRNWSAVAHKQALIDGRCGGGLQSLAVEEGATALGGSVCASLLGRRNLIAAGFRASWVTDDEIVHDKTGRCNITAIYRVAKFMLRMARPYRRTEQALQIKWTIM